ncbi:MAG: GNAT family N-acetyltransferase [Acidimicrobiales bacterium]
MGGTLEIQDVVSQDDRRAALVVANRARPWAFESVLRADALLARPARVLWEGVALVEGQAVGVARVREPFDDGSGTVMVSVDVVVRPEFRSEGIGARLTDEVRTRLPVGSPLFLTAWVEASDERSAGHLTKLGFDLGEPELMRHICHDLSSSAGPNLDGSLRGLNSLDERQWIAVHAALGPALDEMPGARADLEPFEEWCQLQRRSLAANGERIVALDGDVPIGFTGFDAGLGVPCGYVDVTFVVPEHRGRGLARAMKLALHASAHRRGLAVLTTAVAPMNAPMLRVNERLGYEPRFRRWGTLRTAAT